MAELEHPRTNGEKVALVKCELGKLVEAYDAGTGRNLDAVMMQLKSLYEKMHNGEH